MKHFYSKVINSSTQEKVLNKNCMENFFCNKKKTEALSSWMTKTLQIQNFRLTSFDLRELDVPEVSNFEGIAKLGAIWEQFA